MICPQSRSGMSSYQILRYEPNLFLQCSFLWREGVGSIPRLGETQMENWRWGKPTPQYLPSVCEIRHPSNAPVNISGWKRGARRTIISERVQLEVAGNWARCHFILSGWPKSDKKIEWPLLEAARGRFENSQRVQIEVRLLSAVTPLSDRSRYSLLSISLAHGSLAQC